MPNTSTIMLATMPGTLNNPRANNNRIYTIKTVMYKIRCVSTSLMAWGNDSTREMIMREANAGEFYEYGRVSDYEHDGDCTRAINDMKRELVEEGVSLVGLHFSWYTDTDEDGEEGFITCRGVEGHKDLAIISRVIDEQ